MERPARRGRHQPRTYDPDRPHRRIPTVMKFAEYENPGSGNLEWLIRKDGCMHCADRLPQGLPGAGAIVKYANGIVDFNQTTASAAAIASPVACSTSRASPRRTRRPKAYALFRPRVGRAGAGLREDCPTGAIVFGSKEDMKEHAAGRIADLKERGFDQSRPVRPRWRRRYARDVRAAPCRSALAVQQPAERAHHQPAGQPVEGRDQLPRPAGHGRGGAGRLLPLHAGRPDSRRGRGRQGRAQRARGASGRSFGACGRSQEPRP